MTACELLFPSFSSVGWTASCQEVGLVAQLASWGVALLFAVAVVAVFLSFMRQGGGSRAIALWRLLSWTGALFAGLLLAIAAGRPQFVYAPTEALQHFIFVVDQSESAHRDEGARKVRIRGLARQVSALLAAEDNVRTRVSLIDFAASSEIRLNRGTVASGLALLSEDKPSDQLSQEGSDLASALKTAEALAAGQDDLDAIFLLSDGNATTQPLDKLALSLQGRLDRVFVTSLDAGVASEGIVSAYLPEMVRSGSEPTLRLVFNPGEPDAVNEQAEPWTAALKRNGTDMRLDVDEQRAGGGLLSYRIPVRFDGRGIEYAQMDLNNGVHAFSQRVFTLVDAPVRVLGLGDTDFLMSLSKQRFTVEQRAAPDLSDLDDFDMVVLGAVDAAQFKPNDLMRLADAVETRGLGVFLVNGPMHGAADEPTVVQSYAQTALDPLLPVFPDPKYLLEDPPARDTIVLVDTSGSMSGGGLAAARLAVADILDYLRPEDSLELITFGGLSSGKQHGDAQGKRVIRNFASRFPTGDNSNVSRAFERAVASSGNYTSVFLITDGMLDPYDYAKAGLSFYYLQYGSGSQPLNDAIAKAARQSQILQSGQGLAFKPESYDPEEQAEYYSPDLVRPRIVTPIEGISGGLATPGVAFTYARADAIRALVSDGLEGEPVLAFRKPQQMQKGSVGVFLSSLSGAWTENSEGRQSIEASLMQLVKWSARQRYDFSLKDLGDEIAMRISIKNSMPDLPLPQSLTVTLQLGPKLVAVPMAAVINETGVFEGHISLLDLAGSASPASRPDGIRGQLVVQEGGVGALEQAQAIPILLPSAQKRDLSRREAATYGANLSGLEALADASGGMLDRVPNATDFVARFSVPSKPFYPYLILMAAVFFGLSFLAKGGRL